MNRKQKFGMWLGIIAACVSNLVFLFVSLDDTVTFSGLCSWFIWTFGIALLTAGLIITFADKK